MQPMFSNEGILGCGKEMKTPVNVYADGQLVWGRFILLPPLDSVRRICKSMFH